MRSDFVRTVETVRTATDVAGRLAVDGLLPDPTRCRPLAKAWLDGHLPLTLIMDLSMPHGPHSDELLAAEPAPDVAWWSPPEPAPLR